MIVLDANVLIGYLNQDDAHHADVRRLLRAVAADDIAVSTVTLAEALAGPTARGGAEAAALILHDLRITEVSVESGSARHLAELRVGTGLKLPDCLVLHTAEVRAARVASFDHRLRRAAGELALEVLP